MLVLENPGGEPLDRLIQGPMEMTQFLRFAVGMATALSRLHERGLIHKTVQPPDVLVSSATGEVWLMMPPFPEHADHPLESAERWTDSTSTAPAGSLTRRLAPSGVRYIAKIETFTLYRITLTNQSVALFIPTL